MFKFKFTKNNWKIIYKLLNDLLLISVIFFGFSLVADGLITGIITKHISFLKIIIFIALDLIAIHKVETFIDIHPQPIKKVLPKNKTTLFLIILTVFLIFNSLIKLSLWLNLFILILSLLTIYLIYQNLDV